MREHKPATDLRNRRQWPLFLFGLLAPCINPISAVQSAETEPPMSATAPAEVPLDVQMCGPNSLYLILKLYGRPADPGILQDYAPTHPHGMSLLELRDAFNRCGLPMEVRQCGIDEMCEQFRSPLVIYTSSPVRGSGHYMILLYVKDDMVGLMDPTTGQCVERPRTRLERVWQGYILVRPNTNRPLNALLLSSLAWVGLAGFCMLRSRRYRSPVRDSSTSSVDKGGARVHELASMDEPVVTPS